jgi:hypothetical protein
MKERQSGILVVRVVGKGVVYDSEECLHSFIFLSVIT